METCYRDCPKCSGIGYVKPIKADPKYEEYIRLKAKFENKEDS